MPKTMKIMTKTPKYILREPLPTSAILSLQKQTLIFTYRTKYTMEANLKARSKNQVNWQPSTAVSPLKGDCLHMGNVVGTHFDADAVSDKNFGLTKKPNLNHWVRSEGET